MISTLLWLFKNKDSIKKGVNFVKNSEIVQEQTRKIRSAKISKMCESLDPGLNPIGKIEAGLFELNSQSHSKGIDCALAAQIKALQFIKNPISMKYNFEWILGKLKESIEASSSGKEKEALQKNASSLLHLLVLFQTIMFCCENGEMGEDEQQTLGLIVVRLEESLTAVANLESNDTIFIALKGTCKNLESAPNYLLQSFKRNLEEKSYKDRLAEFYAFLISLFEKITEDRFLGNDVKIFAEMLKDEKLKKELVAHSEDKLDAITALSQKYPHLGIQIPEKPSIGTILASNIFLVCWLLFVLRNEISISILIKILITVLFILENKKLYVKYKSSKQNYAKNVKEAYFNGMYLALTEENCD